MIFIGGGGNRKEHPKRNKQRLGKTGAKAERGNARESVSLHSCADIHCGCPVMWMASSAVVFPFDS